MCAMMYPPDLTCVEHEKAEGLIFKSLEKNLPDEYHVFFSKKTIRVKNNTAVENEADFVIYHKEKGLLVIEVKDSYFHYDSRRNRWVFDNKFDSTGNNKIMPKEGPWNQALIEKSIIYESIKDHELAGYLIKERKLKVNCAVWLTKVTSTNNVSYNWPQDASPDLTLFSDHIENPKQRIDQLFAIEHQIPYVRNGQVVTYPPIHTHLTQDDENILFKNIFFPKFIDMSPLAYKSALDNTSVIRFLDEQKFVLNFTENQKFVVINGAAGTGKTLVAVEKARRLAESGDTVLFLCFNAALQQDLTKKFGDTNNISFKTIYKFICDDLTDNHSNDVSQAINTLTYYIDNPDTPFKYKHIIIDEGQDLSLQNFDNENFLWYIYELISSRADDSCLYIFYDDFQRVNGAQSQKLSEVIQDAETKVSLKTNCRNTTCIALASLKPIIINYIKDKISSETNKINNDNSLDNDTKKSQIQRRSSFIKNTYLNRLNNTKGFIPGDRPKMYFTKDNSPEKIKDSVNKIVNNFLNTKKNDKENYTTDDITILTCRTSLTSSFRQDLLEKACWGNTTIKFMTTNTFKGLENDIIILIEVSKNTFTERAMDYYVGASRAKKILSIVTDLSNEDMKNLISNWLQEEIKPNINIENQFAQCMKCSRGRLNNQ